MSHVTRRSSAGLACRIADVVELKKVLNLQRRHTFVFVRGASVYPKLGVADVLPIERSGLSDEQFQYALRSHFDFVVTTADGSPFFVVEFDGPIHGSTRLARRDALKNGLCEPFNLPFLAPLDFS